jgi:hypothetical protein
LAGLESKVELEDVLVALVVLFTLSVVVLDAMVEMALVSSAGVVMVAIDVKVCCVRLKGVKTRMGENAQRMEKAKQTEAINIYIYLCV